MAIAFAPFVPEAVAALAAALGIGLWTQTPAGQEAIDSAAKGLSGALSGAKSKPATKAQEKDCEDCGRRSEDWHHEMPQQFRDRFARAGIDIDAPENGRVIPRAEHQALHRLGYNSDWRGFFDANPNATAGDIYEFKNDMVSRYNLNQYRRPNGRYNVI